MADRPKVLVLGAGFAGLGAARKLAKAPVDVLIVDRHDYHTFQPLLYQVATDLLDPEGVGHPIRELIDHQDNLDFLKATITGIDLDSRTVSIADRTPLDYDFLVIGVGAQVNFFGVPGADEHAFPLYSLNDAIRLKNHLLRTFEAAAADLVSAPTDGSVAASDETAELAELDLVIVGGGATGVETAGAMAELYYSVFRHDFPDLPVADASITLVDHGDRLLAMFDEGLSAYTKDALEDRGVTVMLRETVQEIGERSVTLASGTELPSRTTVWGAGLKKASPLAEACGVDLVHGRVPVDENLRLEGRPEVYVVGDMAWTPDDSPRGALPQLGAVALQAGEHVGQTIDRLTRKHKDPKPFSYTDRGTMATIGRRAAVAVVPPGVHVTGGPAFLLWGAVHLVLLRGGDHRSQALVNWAFSAIKHDRPSRMLIDPSDDD